MFIIRLVWLVVNAVTAFQRPFSTRLSLLESRLQDSHLWRSVILRRSSQIDGRGILTTVIAAYQYFMHAEAMFRINLKLIPRGATQAAGPLRAPQVPEMCCVSESTGPGHFDVALPGQKTAAPVATIPATTSGEQCTSIDGSVRIVYVATPISHSSELC